MTGGLKKALKKRNGDEEEDEVRYTYGGKDEGGRKKVPKGRIDRSAWLTQTVD